MWLPPNRFKGGSVVNEGAFESVDHDPNSSQADAGAFAVTGLLRAAKRISVVRGWAWS
jgi:hypothetical protein